MTLVRVALMTIVAVVAVLWPLARRPQPAVRERCRSLPRSARGNRTRPCGRTIADQEAVGAQVEVSRRLIAAAESPARAASQRGRGDMATPGGRTGGASRRAARRGRTLPCARLAFAAGSAAGAASCRDTRRSVVRQLGCAGGNPPCSQSAGWTWLGSDRADLILRLGRFDDAVKARRQALLRLNGESHERESALGEALVFAGIWDRNRGSEGRIRKSGCA